MESSTYFHVNFLGSKPAKMYTQRFPVYSGPRKSETRFPLIAVEPEVQLLLSEQAVLHS